MPVVPVEDPADDRLLDYRDLRDVDLRRRADAFIGEGLLVLQRALASRWPVRSVLVVDRRLGDLPVLAPEVEVLVAPQAVLDTVVGFSLHRGVVAVLERRPSAAAEALHEGARTVAVLEGVNDAENLGALYRNAAAFGIAALLLDPTTADPFNRRTVRVSMGHVLGVPTARLAAWPVELGLTTVALTPTGDETLDDVAHLERVVFVLGAEGPGLSEAALAAADHRVRIPLAPGIDSLNVATAAAIAFQSRFRP